MLTITSLFNQYWIFALALKVDMGKQSTLQTLTRKVYQLRGNWGFEVFLGWYILKLIVLFKKIVFFPNRVYTKMFIEKYFHINFKRFNDFFVLFIWSIVRASNRLKWSIVYNHKVIWVCLSFFRDNFWFLTWLMKCFNTCCIILYDQYGLLLPVKNVILRCYLTHWQKGSYMEGANL